MAQTALITGASRGIGAAVTRRFASGGFTTIAVSRSIEGPGNGFDPKSGVVCLAADVSSQDSVEALVVALKDRRIDTIDVLVNSAGNGYFGSAEATPLEVWNNILAVNLTGTFMTCKTMLPLLRNSRKPSIFNIISAAGRTPFPNCGAYVASKYGALGFTSVLREELRKDKIRVTAVMPGAVDTPFWDDKGVDFDRKQMLSADEVAASVWHAYDQPAECTTEEIVIKPTRGDF